MKKISVLIPVFNEEENVAECYTAITHVLEQLKDRYEYEMIFTDNHSTDKTFDLLQALAKKDMRVKVARFSKNCGYQRSIYTGYILSTGDAVVQIDCDLQDPPEIILEFIKKWEEGYAVVYGIRRKREEFFIKKAAKKIFYRLINFLSEDKLPHDAGDFRIVDRKIVGQMRQLYDYYPYIRGMISAFGFEQMGIPYERKARKKGKSKFHFTQLFGLAIDGIVSHSIVPLRFAFYIGFFVFCGSFISLVIYVVRWIFYQQVRPLGFTTVISLVLFSMGLMALFLGVIGEYLGRIYQQIKRKPITVIEKKCNLLDKGFED